MPLLCKNIVLHIIKLIFIDLQKLKCHSLLFRLPVKNEKSEIFAVDNDTQKLSFWKLFCIRRRKLIKLKICNCTPNASFPLSTFKVILNFEVVSHV